MSPIFRVVLRRLGMTALVLGVCATPALAQDTASGHGDHSMLLWKATVDQFEYRASRHDASLNWDANAWIGGDDEKVVVKSEGAWLRGGALEEAELQLLYSWRISDFFDAQAGLRYDLRPEPQRGFAVLGVQGLAPYFIEVDAALFASHRGEISARLKAEYDLFVTQNLVLQPAAEVNLALQNVESRGIGRGISNFELGLRLRYEFEREFAPYVGVTWERRLGRTADFARDEGEKAGALSLVAGLRFWF